MQETAIQIGVSFERRHYEAVRCDVLAPAIGRVGLEGAQAAELEELRNRRRIEVTDVLAEGLKLEKPDTPRTAISTHRQFELVDGKIVAQDGEIIEELLLRALGNDIKLANEDPFFAPFLPARTRHELDEHRGNEAMTRGETDHNTIITISPYSEEYDDGSELVHAKLIRAAQKPYYTRAMVRLSHWDGRRLHMFTRSVDNSSVDLMKEAARRQFGYKFVAQDSTAMLGERIYLDIKDSSWQALVDVTVSQADAILAERHGGKWRQGIKEEKLRQALAYVQSQPEIVNSLIRIGECLAIQHPTFESYNVAFQGRLYDGIALLEKRLELGKTDEVIIDYDAASAGAGAIARSEGKSYDACGLVIGTGKKGKTTVGEQTGFESLKRLENKKIACPECDKKVVVDKKYLEKGQLHCKECGYHLDVCTGKASFKKAEKSLTNQVFSALDIIRDWWQQQKHEDKIKKTAQKQAKAELGDNVTYLDVRRHEKQIRQKLAA